MTGPSLWWYRTAGRLRDKAFSFAISGSFASFGDHTVVQPPLRVYGEDRITVGSSVFIGANSWLQVLGDEGPAPVALEIGSGTHISGLCVLSARRRVVIGRSVLMARNVYIADHSHAFGDRRRPILAQGVDAVADVEVADGAWLGQNAVILPGVRVGRGAVVGANSVVNRDVPDRAVVVGAPARVVRTLE